MREVGDDAGPEHATRVQREDPLERHEHEEQHDEADDDVAARDERDEERGEEGDRRGEPDVRRLLVARPGVGSGG